MQHIAHAQPGNEHTYSGDDAVIQTEKEGYMLTVGTAEIHLTQLDATNNLHTLY